MSEASAGAIYLARHADGIAACQRFARSYARHPAGMPHDLVVIYKGFEQPADLMAARAAFDGLPHIEIGLPDVGFDLGAYAQASRQLGQDYLVFLNTHSEIAAPNWLAQLFRCASRDDVGIAGSMGSYESIRNTVLLFRNAIWESIGAGKHYDRWLAYYFDFVLSQYHADWYGPSGEVRAPRPGPAGPFARLLRIAARARRRAWFEKAGTAPIWRGSIPFDCMRFPAFPNPHIRSNGFMMRRARFLQLGLPSTPEKFDTSLFESGPDSMTARLRAQGLRVAVVGADGEQHEVADWWRSGTFRQGDQRNLLFADNHTRAFAAMSPGGRATHQRTTWGDFLGPAPEHFPGLGVLFPKGDFGTRAAG